MKKTFLLNLVFDDLVSVLKTIIQVLQILGGHLLLKKINDTAWLE